MQPPNPVVLNDKQDQYPLGLHLDILRDPGGELTIQDVTSPAIQDQFTPSQVETPNFGYQRAVYWVRFQVRSQAEQTSHWVLEQGFANMHYMDLYLPNPDGTGYLVRESGVMRPYESRDYRFHLLTFNLDIPPGSEQTFYVRFQNQASMTLPLTLWSQNAFTRQMLGEQLALGAFYGILIIMALYNLFLLSIIRERVYLYLVLFIFTWAAFYFLFDASIYQFIPIRSPRLGTSLILVFLGLWVIFFLKFVVELLDLKAQKPKLYRGSRYFEWAFILTVVLAPFLDYKTVVSTQLLIGIVMFLIIIGLCLNLWMAGSRPARFMLASWSLFMISMILTALVRFSILPSTGITEGLYRYGIIWMVVVWSLALADRVNSLKAEAEFANRQLMTNENRLSQFLEAMPVGVAVYDSDLKPRYFNKKTQLMLSNQARNISPDVSAGRTLKEMLAYFSVRALGTEQPYSLEQFPIMRALGGEPATADDVEFDLIDRRLPVEIWASPLLDEGQNVTGAVAAFQDIRERLEKDAKLRESQEIQRLALEGARLGIWSTNVVTGEVMWDARTREIFGVDLDQPATLELGFSLIHPEDRAKAQEAYERAISPQSDGIYAEEKRIVRPDGQICWISTRGKTVFEGQGANRRAVRLVGTVMDVTEGVLAEQALAESETRHRRLVEIMNEGLGETDENDLFAYVNPRLAEMLGYTPDEMIGHPAVEFFDEENRDRIAEQLVLRRSGQQQAYTITWRRKDGSDLHTLVAPTAVFSESREFQRSIAVVTDISEQAKASQVLEQRVAERTRELRTLLEVSQVVAGNLDVDLLLKVILEELRLVVEFSGAAIVTLAAHQLTTLNFPLQIDQEMVARFTQSIIQTLQDSARVMRNQVIIIPDILEDTKEGRDFRAIAAALFDLDRAGIRSWMGVPLMIKQKLVGLLSIHHNQPGMFTPGMGDLAHAFANQAAVAIENAWLYQQAQVTAAVEERNRLARELHDSVTQALYSLTLYAEATRLALGSGKAETANKNLNEVLTIAREGMADLRLLIFELRPSVLDKEGLVGALQARLEAVEARAGCQAEFHVEGQPELSLDDETELYWVVHEALNNVLKHSRARHVYMDMVFQNSEIMITIRDDGIGLDVSQIGLSSGMGFKNISERLNRIGGSLNIESMSGQGTVLQIKVARRK